MPIIKDMPQHLRPREKLLARGVENLTDAELLAILLRTGYQGKNIIQLSQHILKKFPLSKFLDIKVDDITQIKGLSLTKASTLLAALEFGKRSLQKYNDRLPVLNNSKIVLSQLNDILKLRKEHFVVLYLNARNQLIHKETISIGTVNAAMVHPREVFEPAIRKLASQVILAHNHPSGDCFPSNDDIQVTKKLVEAGELLDIQVLDHLIVSLKSYYSFKAGKKM